MSAVVVVVALGMHWISMPPPFRENGIIYLPPPNPQTSTCLGHNATQSTRLTTRQGPHVPGPPQYDRADAKGSVASEIPRHALHTLAATAIS